MFAFVNCNNKSLTPLFLYVFNLNDTADSFVIASYCGVSANKMFVRSSVLAGCFALFEVFNKLVYFLNCNEAFKVTIV